MKIEQGAIILVKFPFTDLSNQKLRPAVIVSGGEYNKRRDVIIAGITSHAANDKYIISLKKDDFIEGTLLQESYIKCGKLLSLERSLILRPVAVLTSKKLREVINTIKNILK